jgi:hypothetical protein
MLRVNPLFVMFWWILWLIPLFIGLRMYLRDDGLVWQRTKKTNANESLVLEQLERDGALHTFQKAQVITDLEKESYSE